MKCCIYENELWPYYDIDDDCYIDDATEVPAEQITEWKRVMADFYRVQREMKAAHDTPR